MDFIISKLGGAAVGYAAGGVGAVAIAWMLKKIPNATLKLSLVSLCMVLELLVL